jgi:hypothetical protein
LTINLILNCAVKSKLIAVVGLLCSAVGVWAQSSTFTYQGQLSSNGAAATGLFDVRFALYDAATVGNQVGAALTNSPTGVTNGLFQVTLNFGSSGFDGNSRWLELGVRTNGSTGAFTTLTPRQQITATPYAVRAANFSGTLAATNLTGKISDTNLSVNVALLTNTAVFTRTVTASNFVGNASGLTNLLAANLVGSIPDALLSGNVAFRNTSNTVFQGGVTATNFYGEGRGLTNVPGRIFEFVPTAVNIQAYPNYGYLATNDTTPVIVTLPTNAQMTNGNVVRVSASGTAGWIIAQNTNQTILLGNLLNNVGTSWTTNSTVLSAKAVACSADGSKMVAAVSSGNIYTSTNYGANWTSRASPLNWSGVASSANGTKLVACVNGTSIYTSTDSGVNWTPRFGSANWTSVATSLDGTRIIAGSSSAGVYTSTDSGASWVQRINVAASWNGVATSANGLNMVAVGGGQSIWISTNAGTNWVQRETGRAWTCVTSSADAGVLVAGASGGLLYTSTDFGASWMPNTVTMNWAGLACSADGQRIIATGTSSGTGGGVYISQDTGLTWQLRGNLPTNPSYTGAASSSDGSTLAATALANGIFVSSKASTTIGVAGQLIGARLAAVELQYVGNGVFIPLSSAGAIRAK